MTLLADQPDVVIVGGGLAGLAAAAALGAAGYRVDLHERRPFLGGRASSAEFGVRNAECGMGPSDSALHTPHSALDTPGSALSPQHSALSTSVIDNCQHVLLGCCTNLLNLYERLGVRHLISFHDAVPFVTPDGRISIMRERSGPVPFHLLVSLARFHPLSWRDRLAVMAGLAAVGFEPAVLGRPRLDSETMLAWLKRHLQTPRAIDYFWRPVLTSALNEDPERVSAWHGLQVFWLGFLANRAGHRVGLSAVPLGDLYRAQIPGVRVHLRSAVRELLHGTGRVAAAALDDGRIAPARWFIVAVPFEETARLLPGDYSAFSHSPIIGIHLWFDRPLFEAPFAALLGRTVQWVFRKHGDSGYVQCVVSAARELLRMPPDQIVETAVRELREFFPTTWAQLLRSSVIKEARATYSAAPGVEARRPSPATPFANCFQAGDWTATGWPPTMEGAVRSGYAAAERLSQAAGHPQRFLLPELPAEGLSRWFPAARLY